jgi:hypothetical protein
MWVALSASYVIEQKGTYRVIPETTRIASFTVLNEFINGQIFATLQDKTKKKHLCFFIVKKHLKYM